MFRQCVSVVSVYAGFQTMCQCCQCLCLFSDNVSILLLSMPVFRQHVCIVGVYAGFQTTCQCTAMRVATRSAPTSSWRLTCCSVSSPRLTARRKLTRWAWGDCPIVDVGKVGLGQLSRCRCGKWGELVCSVSLVQLEFHFKTFLGFIRCLSHTRRCCVVTRGRG